ncbi:hypothetical protein RCL1_003842 [Eukaryota sp. TZLM3-RCL]
MQVQLNSFDSPNRKPTPAFMEMSRRLLKNWTLCDSVHECCSLPLVFNPNATDPKKQYYCSYCRIYLQDDEDQSIQIESNSPLSSPSSTQAISSIESQKSSLAHEEEQMAEPFEPVSEHEDKTGSVHDDDSFSTLETDDFKDDTTEVLSSHARESDIEEEQVGDDISQAPSEHVIHSEDDFIQNSGIIPTSLDEVSKLLGEKMLQGYALLDKLCPGCCTPLVSKKTVGMYCVLCNCRVVTEEEYDPDTMIDIKESQQVSEPVKNDLIEQVDDQVDVVETPSDHVEETSTAVDSSLDVSISESTIENRKQRRSEPETSLELPVKKMRPVSPVSMESQSENVNHVTQDTTIKIRQSNPFPTMDLGLGHKSLTCLESQSEMIDSVKGLKSVLAKRISSLTRHLASCDLSEVADTCKILDQIFGLLEKVNKVDL